MKGTLLTSILLVSTVNLVFSQEQKPELLKQPGNWEFERFSLPPAFAPAITYKGFEELRFAPGMFKKDSIDYFSYAFIASIDSVRNISQRDIQIYLLRYYKGLCHQVAKDNKLTIDTAQIGVTVINKKLSLPTGIIYYYVVNVFGVFTDGAPVKLNMEAEVTRDVVRNRLYILFITSPQAKTSDVWKELYQIREAFKIPSG